MFYKLRSVVVSLNVEITYAQQVKVFRSVSHTTSGGKNDFSVFDYSTRKTCTDTFNVKRVGRPSNKQFLNVELFHFANITIHS